MILMRNMQNVYEEMIKPQLNIYILNGEAYHVPDLKKINIVKFSFLLRV